MSSNHAQMSQALFSLLLKESAALVTDADLHLAHLRQESRATSLGSLDYQHQYSNSSSPYVCVVVCVCVLAFLLAKRVRWMVDFPGCVC